MQYCHYQNLPQTTVVFALFLHLLHLTSSLNKANPYFKQVKLERKSSSADSSCNRLVNGQTSILAAGQLPDRFLLLTTDLFLFDIHPTSYLEQSKLPPPFRVLLNGAPTHLSDRFPKSYAAFSTIAGNIIYGYTLSFHYKSEDNKQYRKDYLAFVYFNKSSNNNYCLFGIDFHADQPINGLCSATFSDIQVISYIPQVIFLSAYVRTDEHPQQMFCGIEVQEMTVLVGDEPISDSEKDGKDNGLFGSENMKTPCFTLEKCVEVKLVGETINGQKEVAATRQIPGRCTPFGSKESSRLSAGFFITDSQVYLIDESATVHAMEDMNVRRVFASMPIGQFIGCNVQLPWKFTFNS